MRACSRPCLSLAAAAGVSLAAGCHEHHRASFGDTDPAARLEAIRRAAGARDRAAIPELIRSLDSDDPAERMAANIALVDITGQDLGYDHAAPLPARRAAAERWALWYAEGTGARPRAGPGAPPTP